MLVAALAIAVVVVIALGIQLRRTNARLAAVTDDLGAAIARRDESEVARRAAESAATTANRERDDALERASRARRDAAEVAKRMKDEAQARAAADAAREETAAEATRLASELAAAEAAVGGASDEQVAELWTLAVAGVQRTWEISVAPSPGMPSPLEDADDLLRAAIGVEVDAAREEAGAAVELSWTGDAEVPPARAVRALSIAQELIARLSKTAEEATLRVCTSEEGVTIEVDASDAEGRSVVPGDVAVEHQIAPGRYELR